jgi:hypothetical protein
MRIIVSYHERDIYSIPDGKWHEAMALCNNDVENAIDFLIEKGLYEPSKLDVTDRHIDVEEDR